ncbi:MAG: cytidylate kinase-like family protein [Elusimicrobiota bacterium]|jgi:cytidylate kinase
MDKVSALIQALAYSVPPVESESSNQSWPFITISRQAGAGGYTLAKALMHELEQKADDPFCSGWSIFGVTMCRQLLEKHHLHLSQETLRKEDYHSQLEDLGYQIFASHSSQEYVFHRISTEIRTAAIRGKVIIIGRGGSCLTGDLPNGIHVRLVASLDARVHRMQELQKCPEAKARQIVHERDAARSRYVHDRFGRDIDDPTLYDVIWNTERVAIPDVAQQLMAMIRSRAARPVLQV